MRYLLILDDNWIERDADSTPYVTLALKNDTTIKLIVTPISEKRPYLVFEHGGAYLEPRYIDAMLAFEARLKMAEALDKMFANLDGTHKYDIDNITVRELEKHFPDIDVPRYDGDKNIISLWKNEEAKNV